MSVRPLAPEQVANTEFDGYLMVFSHTFAPTRPGDADGLAPPPPPPPPLIAKLYRKFLKRNRRGAYCTFLCSKDLQRIICRKFADTNKVVAHARLVIECADFIVLAPPEVSTRLMLEENPVAGHA